MKTKVNQRVALTKRLLQESLLQLMSEKSIQKINVKELCDDAGINRSTFYNHYGCPSDVLADIERRVIEDLEKLEKASGENWPLNKRMEAMCSYLLEHRDMAKLLLRDSDINSGFASRIINAAHVQEIYEKILSYVESEDSRQLITTFLNTGTYHMIRQWILEDIPKTPEEMGELLNSVATHGWVKNV